MTYSVPDFFRSLVLYPGNFDDEFLHEYLVIWHTD